MKQVQSYCYLGGTHALDDVEVGTRTVDGQLLGASVSANVARRYGEVVTRLIINDVATKVLTLAELRSGSPTLADFRDSGYSAVRVTGDAQDFDFPVDMVIALDKTALTVHSVVSATELLACQAGLSQVHQPQGPSSLGWSQMVAASGLGDRELEVRGWVFFDNGVCRGSVPADDNWREYLVCAIPLAKGWLIEDNYGDAEGYANTRADALSMADWWRRHEMTRRRQDLERAKSPHPEVFDEDCFPF
jgi:hypothetical protein